MCEWWRCWCWKAQWFLSRLFGRFFWLIGGRSIRRSDHLFMICFVSLNDSAWDFYWKCDLRNNCTNYRLHDATADCYNLLLCSWHWWNCVFYWSKVHRDLSEQWCLLQIFYSRGIKQVLNVVCVDFIPVHLLGAIQKGKYVDKLEKSPFCDNLG